MIRTIALATACLAALSGAAAGPHRRIALELSYMADAVYAAANAAYAQIGLERGWIMSHLSHSYHSGACLYFTFAFVAKDDMLAEYDVVKHAIQQAFLDHGGTLSHHHAVGLEHADWMEQDISAGGVAIMRSLFAGTDPESILNPGKILAD